MGTLVNVIKKKKDHAKRKLPTTALRNERSDFESDWSVRRKVGVLYVSHGSKSSRLSNEPALTQIDFI